MHSSICWKSAFKVIRGRLSVSDENFRPCWTTWFYFKNLHYKQRKNPSLNKFKPGKRRFVACILFAITNIEECFDFVHEHEYITLFF